MAARHAILVLGMHRSGTSALTRTLALCGAGLPATLFPAVSGDNDAGYWESSRLIDFHQWLLWHLGTGMLDPALPAPHWYESSDAAGVVDRLAALVEEEWGAHPCWVVKEPRLCRLLPLWRRVFQRLERRVLAVHCLREPSEVAASLSRRDGFPRATAELLWLQHVALAERDSRAWPRAFVAYDALLDDWTSTIRRIARHLPDGMIDVARGARAVHSFLDPGLRRQRHSEQSPLEPMTRAVRDALFTACATDGEPSAALLDQACDWCAAQSSPPPAPS